MSKRAEEFAVRIHNTALRKAEKYASEHGMGVLGEVSYGWGFKAGAITGYEQAEKDLGWISVNDRLPEEDGRYITCHATCGVPTMVSTSIFFEGRWVLVPEGEIDYWMEIPKLPMEEEK